MKIILPGLTLVMAAVVASAAIAQLPGNAAPASSGASAPAVEALSPGDHLLRQVVAQLEHRETIAARLRYQVSLDGRQLSGAGSYWQEGSGELLRVRLELRVASAINLLQVSNGRLLWTDLTLPTGRTVTQVDLRQLRNYATHADDDFDDIAPGQATWSPLRPDLTAHAGGLPALAASLEEHFTFAPPQAMRWTPSPPLSGVGDSLPVFAIVGRWKRDQLLPLLPKLENEIEAGQQPALPSRVPQEVLVLVGQTDLFPYRIEYRRLNDRAVAQSSLDERQPYQLSADPLVVLEYYDVAFNAPIAVGRFDYSPGDAQWDDRTAEHLERLRRQRQQLATRNTTEQK